MNINLPIDFEFDHVGIAVHSLSEGEKVYLAMGFSEGHVEEVKSEKVRVKMFNLKNNSRIELLEPTDKDSAVAKFLEKRWPWYSSYMFACAKHSCGFKKNKVF